MKSKSAVIRFLALAGSSLLALSSAHAATVNWDGDTSTDWSDSSNWSALPVNDLATDIANFDLASYGGNPVYAPDAGTTSIKGITLGAVNGAMTLTTTNLSIGNSGISIANGAGAFTLAGGVTIGANQSWTNNSASLFSVGGGTVSGSNLTVVGTGNTSISSTISGSAGLTKNGAGTLTLTGANDYTGLTTVGTGTLRGTQTSGTPFGTGTTLIANSTLSVAPTGSGADVALADGDIARAVTFSYNPGAIFSLDSGSHTSLTYTFAGNGAGVVSRSNANSSLILSTSDIAKFGAQGSNRERFIINGNAPTQVNTLVSSVVIQDRNNSNAGDFATYDATHGFTKASYTLTNDFTGSTDASLVEINSATSTSGATAAYALKASGATVTNTGNTLTLGSGTNPAAGLILNGGTLDGGTLTTSSNSTQFVIYTSGTSVISSSINNTTGGTGAGAGLNLIGPGTLDVSGSSGNSFTNGIQLRTTLIATNDNQLGDPIGSIVMAGGTLQTSGTFALGGAGQRAITVNAGQDQIGSTFNVTSGTTTFQSASGSPAKIMSGTGALIKTGAGTLVLSGNTSNTYNGGTFVNQGTLRLGAANMLANTGAVSIGNATLDASTFTETVGTLDLTANAIIHLDTGAALTFADSSAVSWTGGTLTITGTFVPNVSLRFGTTNSGLTSTQLGSISATGWTNFSLDASGFLTAQTQYEAWANGDAFDADANGDGVSNGLAFLLGAADKDVSALDLLPEVSENAGGLVMTFQMLNADARGDASLAIEHSNSLESGSWTTITVPDSNDTVGDVVFSVSGTNPLDVTATIPASKAGGTGKLFGRLKGVNP